MQANQRFIPNPSPHICLFTANTGLGVADCWRDPANFPNRPPALGAGPHTLTPAQEADRTRTWPPL